MRFLLTGAAGAAILAVSAVVYAQAGDSIGTGAQTRGAQAPTESASIGTPAEALRTKSQVRVIVELVDPKALPGASAAMGERKAIAALQTSVIDQAFGTGVARDGGDGHGLVRMSSIPVFAINVDKAGLGHLEADPRVKNIGLDFDLEAQLNQSVNLIQMNQAWKAPYVARGTGRSVAIIDTGVNLTHKFLKSSRIIAQACFSGAGNASNSFCPNGKVQQTGGKSGKNCPLNYNANCSHGTHVAGIASGFNTNKKAGEPNKGVAYTSKIIAVQVFKKSGGDINTAFSDMIKALDWLYKKRNTFAQPLASINMSIGGGGPFSSNCNNNNSFSGPAFKAIIDKLRSAGIASVISSGNDGFTDGVSAPACISTAVTVGSSSKKTSGQPERIAYYSNIGSLVDVLAPGGDVQYPTGTSFTPAILSSVPGNKFDGFQGTSMAAPHIAGVFAAIRSAKSCGNKSVNAIETALKQTGKKIPDVVHKNKRRVNVKNALDALGCKKKTAKTTVSSAQ